MMDLDKSNGLSNYNKDSCDEKKIKKTYRKYFNQQFLDFFSIRLSNLEENFSEREKNVNDIMFTMHDISMLAQRLKTEIIKPTINSFIKKKRKEEDLNLSKLSNISRITSSSYRRDLVKTKTMKEKKAIVTQLVEINLENGKSSLIRKIKSTETKLTNMDDFTCSNQQQNH